MWSPMLVGTQYSIDNIGRHIDFCLIVDDFT